METTSCLGLLKIYRLKLEIEAGQPQNGRTKAEAAMADYEIKQSYYEAAKCVRDLPALLNRLASTGK